MTRSLQLPFVPSPEVLLHSSAVDECPEPLGFKPENIIWDIDRRVFLATTDLINEGVPFPLILHDIRRWLSRGWRLGSYMDAYESDDEEEKAPSRHRHSVLRIPVDEWDEDEMEGWRKLAPTKRPKEYNALWGVLVRLIIELRNNESKAYAMEQTKRFFLEEEQKKDFDGPAGAWRALTREFEQWPIEKQIDWGERVIEKYPSIEDALGLIDFEPPKVQCSTEPTEVVPKNGRKSRKNDSK